MRACERCSRPYFPLRRGYCHRCDMTRRATFGYQCSYVDADPVRAHITVLRAAGMGLRHIARVAGLNRKLVQNIVYGRAERGSPPCKRVSAATSAAILAVPIPQRDRDAVADGDLVDAVGTVRRLQALVAWGYPRSHLGAQLGWTGGPTSYSGNISKLMRSTQVRASTAARVDAMFRELQMVPGWSSRARSEGAAKGWPLPMDWDEDLIDDRCASTDVSIEWTPIQLDVHDHYCSFADRYVEFADSPALTFSDDEIARRMGIKFESLQRRKARHARCIELLREQEQEAS